PPALGRGYPNLATVPRPPKVPPVAVREADLNQLLASRDTSIRENRQIRAADPGRDLPPPRLRAAPAPSVGQDRQANPPTTDIPEGSRWEEGGEPDEKAAPAS